MLLLMLLVFFLVFAIALFAFLTYFDERRGQSRMMKDRLQSVTQAEARGKTEELALLRDELMSEIPALDKLLKNSSTISDLQRFLLQADLRMKPGKFILIVCAAAICGGALGMVLSGSIVLGAVMFAVGGVLPFGVVAFLRDRRFRRFEKGFPEAIDFLARAVRAGHAFSTALEMIGQELNEPVAGEFRTLFEEQKFGLPLRDALLNLAERVPIVDVKFFVTSVMLQRETGGNIAEILDKLSYVIRERFKILRQVRTFTAQGRMTMIILMSLPPGICLILLMINRNFIMPLFHDPLGHVFIMIGITLQTIGFFIIRKIINIQV